MEKLTTLDRAIRLQKVTLFSELETDILALLASIAKQVDLPVGKRLFEENQPVGALYVVLDGQIEMQRGEGVKFTVGQDETIGNWALFDDQPSVVSARALEDSSLLRIDREDFYDLLADHTEMTQRMFQALFRRVRSVLTASLERGEGEESGGGQAAGVS